MIGSVSVEWKHLANLIVIKYTKNLHDKKIDFNFLAPSFEKDITLAHLNFV